LLVGTIQDGLRIDVAAKLSELVDRLPQPAEVSIPLGSNERETLTIRVKEFIPRVTDIDVGTESLSLVLTLDASAAGELTLHLPVTSSPQRLNPPMRNGPPPPLSLPPNRPSGRYARAPGGVPPRFVPPRPPDLGRPVSHCACWPEPIGAVVTFSPGVCLSSRAISVVCAPPCFGEYCGAPICPDGQPVRQRQCAF
jgi:hypothetical protein